MADVDLIYTIPRSSSRGSHLGLGLAVARQNQGSMRHCELNRGWCSDRMDFLEPKCPELEDVSNKIPTSCEYSEYNFYNKHHVFKKT